ncbi:uncharacterized protein LOC108622531 [Ceratina calcarata]|uniref:Pre-rRNA-processing protein TSR2 homolog n=1 Tax=Ceratina calcarata TaxID=156304 RepID=A0AAJ7IT77_9HYME|nr:uncharacterized protein LOC108622531 [Ceratina calcarata]
MSNSKEFFLSVTQRVFSNWTALKMAVEYGMGTKDRAVDFCPYMTDVIFMNDDLKSKDIADVLEDYMDDQFNTELEDGSAIQVAEELYRFYRYCVRKEESVALEEFSKLSPLQPWLLTNEPVKSAQKSQALKNDSSDTEEEEEEEEAEAPVAMEVDDGWTEVKSRRKR